MSESMVAAEQLRSFIERVEHLEEERKGLASDIKSILLEAKSSGFEPKVLRKIISLIWLLRKKSVADRQEEETLLQLYLDALGEV